MYVMKKDAQTYVYVRDGKNYVSNVYIEGTSALTIYMPDGTLLANASVTINGVAYTTDANGKVYLTGEYGKSVTFNIVYGENYKGSVQTTYGTDVQIHLIQLYLLTVTATGFRYSNKFTITTTIGEESYTGSQAMYVPAGTSVSIKSVGESGYDYAYSGAYVIVDGTSTGTSTHTFTMDTDHVITFEDGEYNSWSVGT